MTSRRGSRQSTGKAKRSTRPGLEGHRPPVPQHSKTPQTPDIITRPVGMEEITIARAVEGRLRRVHGRPGPQRAESGAETGSRCRAPGATVPAGTNSQHVSRDVAATVAFFTALSTYSGWIIGWTVRLRSAAG